MSRRACRGCGTPAEGEPGLTPRSTEVTSTSMPRSDRSRLSDVAEIGGIEVDRVGDVKQPTKKRRRISDSSAATATTAALAAAADAADATAVNPPQKLRWRCGSCGKRNKVYRITCRSCGAGAPTKPAMQHPAPPLIPKLQPYSEPIPKQSPMPKPKKPVIAGGSSYDGLVGSSHRQVEAPSNQTLARLRQSLGATIEGDAGAPATDREEEIAQLFAFWKQPTAEQVAAITAAGLEIATGRWSQSERNRLYQNMVRWSAEHGEASIAKIAGRNGGWTAGRHAEQNMYRELGKGLHRSLQSVVKMVKRHVAVDREVAGQFNDVEKAQVTTLLAVHGRQWSKIAKHVGRTPDSVRGHVRFRRNVKGKWSTTDDDALTKAVYEVTNRSAGDNIDSGVPWKAVAAKLRDTVGRSDHQCAERWYNTLNWQQRVHSSKGDNTKKRPWKITDSMELVHALRAEGAEDESEIYWRELARTLPTPRSGEAIRQVWMRLKQKLPQWETKEFAECLDEVSLTFRSHLVNSSDEED